MKLTRHIGVNTGSNTRIALILTVLPNTEDCLVVTIDSLPADLRDNFQHILSSTEGQNAVNLSDVLGRRLYSDSGKSLLETLHNYGFIRKASIDTVEMTPSPSIKVPLRTVLVESKIIPRPVEKTERFNPHHYNAQAANIGEAIGTARNLLLEADLLEQDAGKKREKAYQIAPSMRPGYEPPKPEAIDLSPPKTPEPFDLTGAFDGSAKPADAPASGNPLL